jgi:uncharacterized membrane protein
MNQTILKVVSWRILSITITMVVLFLYTGDIKSASGITLFLHTFLTFFHFIFETVWERYVSK